VKNAPKSIVSDAMKRSIPRVAGSTRELRFAGGGPWCAWASACAVTTFSSLRSEKLYEPPSP
jgi:hypothetical protein